MESAKWIIAFVAVFCYGRVVADAIVPATSKMHLWNPRWPPHAKFHNCQTMLMGILTGSVSLFILFYFRPLTLTFLLLAAGVASIYWVSMVFSPLFPGTAWSDPEFVDEGKRPLGLNPQQLLGYILCLLVAVAVCLAVTADPSTVLRWNPR